MPLVEYGHTFLETEEVVQEEKEISFKKWMVYEMNREGKEGPNRYDDCQVSVVVIPVSGVMTRACA